MSEQKELSFEEAMNQLEKVVNQLEEGDVPLEEAIAMFQKGMQLSKLCHEKLEVVEAQMEEVLHDNGEIEVTAQEDYTK